MKTKNIKNTVAKVVFSALPLLGVASGGWLLSSCNDYLDVKAPSAYDDSFVYGYKSEMERALNGVYAQALKDDLYGNIYQGSLVLNSDVDLKDFNASAHNHDTFQRFDGDAQSSTINKFWTAAYNLIEYANKFIYGVEHSSIYSATDGDMQQWIGEAKCLRAMAYHDLVVMFGDVPFTLQPTSEYGADYITPVVDRTKIHDSLIADLKDAAPKMKSTHSVTVERCSKEFAYGMVARMALTAGGYSLRPDAASSTSYGKMERPANYLDYYKTAMAAADTVIRSGTHSLTQSYQDVFVNECNYKVVDNDDPIFEIPFAKMSTGYTGYSQGPKYTASEGKTVGAWGACGGSVTVNAFYRFLFREGDARREFVNGFWNYGYYTNADGVLADSVYIKNDRTLHNNKWSKLWTEPTAALGSNTTSGTGINFPYMRYADILLMYAEAANEVQGGPAEQSVHCFSQVHNRAFPDGDNDYYATCRGNKDTFFKAILNERKWEFAGENMRWRDLVRTNLYSEELMYSFLRYYSAGMQSASGMSGYEDDINQHDGFDIDKGEGYIDKLPTRIFYHGYSTSETLTPQFFLLYGKQLYGCRVTKGASATFTQKYPLQQEGYNSLRIYNAYAPARPEPTTSLIKNFGFKAAGWLTADLYSWGDASTSQPNDYVKYTFYGFMRCDANGTPYVVKDGALVAFSRDFITDPGKLPVVRYILPFPQTVIQRSNGQYKNYYAY